MDEKKRHLKQLAFEKLHEKMSDELLYIWDKKDENEYSEIEFEVIEELLKSRYVNMNAPRTYNEKSFKKETSNQYEQSEGGYWSFDKMVSGSLIKVLYVLGALAITIFSVIMLINGSQARYVGSTVILLALVYLVLGNLFWRIVCEGIIIIFKIFEKLNQIELKIK